MSTIRGDVKSQTLALLDEDVAGYSLADWRARNLRLYDILVALGLLDPELVPRNTVSHLVHRLINLRVGACNDPQNAGHVRAQNENVLLFGIAADVPVRTLTLALVAGFVHDLNKAFREPLREDALAVGTGDGGRLALMSSLGQIVGLNHLGDRTRREFYAATRLSDGAIAPEIAHALDMVVVHHGLGSSQFIRDLIKGENAWWGSEFVDPSSGEAKIVHPAQPELTLESVVHDLADSAQQMQGGVAWLLKYPAGYWRASQRSYTQMLTGEPADATADVPMSLLGQIVVEEATCRDIIATGLKTGVVAPDQASAFERALAASIAPSKAWVNGDPEVLEDADGETVYHDVGRALGISAVEAKARLEHAAPGSSEGDEVEDLIWASGRKLDSLRAKMLTDVLHGDAEV